MRKEDLSRFLPLTLVLAVLAAAAGAQETHETRIDTPGELTRLELTLPDALEGRTIALHLGLQDGAVRQAWGFVSGSTRVIDALDVAKLTWADGKLAGPLVCWVNLDGESQTRRLQLDLQATVDESRCAGSYTGRHSVLTDTLTYDTDSYIVEPGEFSLFHYGQTLKGPARARWVGPARAEKATLTLWTRHALTGDSSWQRYVTLDIDIADGKAVDVKITPSNGARAGWVASPQANDLRFDGRKLTGSVTFKVATPRTAGVDAGVYRFAIDAAVENNTLRGSTSVSLDGKTVAGGVGLAGVGESSVQGAKAPRLRVIELTNAIEGARDLRVHLLYEGESFKRGVAFHPTFPEWWPVELLEKGDGFRVAFTENSYMTSKADAVTVPYELSFEAAADGQEGTYRCTFGSYVETGGKLTGRVVPPEELRRAGAIRKGHDWPFWNGPNSNFAAVPSGHELVRSLDEAKVMWIGEDIPPARCQTTRYGEGNLVRFLERGGATGGGCSPVLADGRIYLYYFQPSGGEVGDYVKQMAADKRHVLRSMWLTRADDVVLCMDAATGQTIWKTTFPGQGRYFGSHGTGQAKGAYTANLAVAGGKAVIQTTGGWTHCLDAGSGKRVWSSRQGVGALPIIAADVVVASGNDVVALGLDDGRPRWTVEDAGSPTAIPVRWVHKGVEYIVSGTQGGKLTCIEAKTGKVLWQKADAGDNTWSMSLHGDTLVCNGAAYGKRAPMQLAAYRLSTAGAERLWMIPASERTYDPYKAPACLADGYAFVRLSDQNRVYAADLATGKIVRDLAVQVGSAGYVYWMDDRLAVQPDASHSRTDLWWFDVSNPSAFERPRDLWSARHRTTSSYYPVLMSHALADGRIFIRGQRGIICYDLRKRP